MIQGPYSIQRKTTTSTSFILHVSNISTHRILVWVFSPQKNQQTSQRFLEFVFLKDGLVH